ncbi:MAG: hypothetical protein IMY74_02510 [Bacteroidetes bacterium]|nr:hypothetical protein [Bacteroidota bacterium]
MGIGYSVDTPLKISRYGMDSVISLVDDILFEQLRKMYCSKHDIAYTEITKKTSDYRAKRITAYLNLIKSLSEKKFEELKNSGSENADALQELISMLPENSELKQKLVSLTAKGSNSSEIKNFLDDNLSMGSIDVNIMTKIDKDNYKDGEKLPVEYNDAHAALRGYAESELESSLVLSAGINPRLYSYMQEFEDFYPDKTGYIKKKIALKVSDYKSAMIQGKFLAKKGLWVSEYRIESGLNCGGHAFATDGYLMGPILEEFREKRNELIRSIHEVLTFALAEKDRLSPKTPLQVKITAQGGVGTAEEHQFLIDHYGVDSVGWGTPFLLVPEATNVDDATLDKLINAKEDKLYLSDISPLNVPFNSLRGNTKDLEKSFLVAKGKPGSPCPKKLIALNKEFTEKPICAASRHYQVLKIKELDRSGVSGAEYRKKYDQIVTKACICVGLGTTSLLVNDIDTGTCGNGVSICPGPNMAYFSRTMSLKEITNHIYGRSNMIQRKDRPNMFIKELNIYIDYLKNKIEEMTDPSDVKRRKYFTNFALNLQAGIDYYFDLFTSLKGVFESRRSDIHRELENANAEITLLIEELETLPEMQLVLAGGPSTSLGTGC